jgi:hypothetical protein
VFAVGWLAEWPLDFVKIRITEFFCRLARDALSDALRENFISQMCFSFAYLVHDAMLTASTAFTTVRGRESWA